MGGAGRRRAARSGQAAAGQERLDARVPAPVGPVGDQRVARVPAGEELPAEGLPGPAVQAQVAVAPALAVGTEPGHGVGVHDLAPDVGVVGGGVAPGEDVGEVGRLLN